MKTIYRLKAHSSTVKTVVFCLRPHKSHDNINLASVKYISSFSDNNYSNKESNIKDTELGEKMFKKKKSKDITNETSYREIIDNAKNKWRIVNGIFNCKKTK